MQGTVPYHTFVTLFLHLYIILSVSTAMAMASSFPAASALCDSFRIDGCMVGMVPTILHVDSLMYVPSTRGMVCYCLCIVDAM